MVEMNIVYQGELHCELTHGPSKTVIETDAPKDNMGKGEKFSPTDLVGAALGSCILTTMAIAAQRHNFEIKGAKARVTKEMNPNPRRIASLSVEVTMPAGVPQAERARLEHIAHGCPVHKSLHPEVQMPITFTYPD